MTPIDHASHFNKQLSAYIDGELTPKESHEVEDHLEVCPSCREEYNRLLHVSELASSGLRAARCISAADRVAYIHDLMDEARRREVEEHLARCRNCRAEVDQLKKWVEERFEPEDEAPADEHRKRKNFGRFLTVFFPLAAAATLVVGVASTLLPKEPELTGLNVRVAATTRHDPQQGIEVRFGEEHPLHANDQIQLIIDPVDHNYAVVLRVDSTGRVRPFKAGPFTTELKYLRLSAKREGGVSVPALDVVLPSADKGWPLGPAAGTDAMFIVFTKEPLGAALINKAQQALSMAGPTPKLSSGRILWLGQRGRWTGSERVERPADTVRRLNKSLAALKGTLAGCDAACRGVAFSHE